MEWFKTWFDSKYYHYLYNNRNNKEAKNFIYLLIKFLNLKSGLKVLDLGCGIGRHSKELNKLGFNVVGIDLSKKNIEFIKKFENNSLKFMLGDMRISYYKNEFDVIFNLFTSFGYFDSNKENFVVFDKIKEQLNINGLFIFDYLNSNYLINHLIKYEEKLIRGIKFKIYKYINSNNTIVKIIKFNHKEEKKVFYEKVKLLFFSNIKYELEKRKFIIQNVFGSYKLDDYDINMSKRLIIIAKKTE